MRIYPRRNPRRIYPVPGSRIYPLPGVSDQAFRVTAGDSERILLNQTGFPFGGLAVARGTVVSTTEYFPPGGGWTTVSLGNHADLVEALRNVTATPTVWADPAVWQARLTDDGANQVVVSVDVQTTLIIRQRVVRVPVGRIVKPFARAEFAANDTGIPSVKYAVSGAATIAKTDIPRASVVTGTHDGSNNAAALADSTADFDAHGVQAGDTVSNDTDGSEAVITTVTATTLSGTLSGGTDNDWDSGDGYTVYAADDLVSRVKKFEYAATPAGTHKLTLYVGDAASPVVESVDIVEVIAF